MNLQQRSLKALEWEKLTQHLADNCETQKGRAKALNLVLRESNAEIELLLNETDQAAALLERRSEISFANLPPLDVALAKAEAGAVLSGEELVQVRRLLESAKKARSSLSLLEPEHFSALTDFVPKLKIAEELRSACAEKLDESGAVHDDASPKLKNLRHEFRQKHARIKDELNKLIHASAITKALQEPLFTQRNGRYVLPVEVTSRNSVPGIVHDTSASGQTIYVEPVSVIERTNDARMIELETDREIERILAELSAIAHERAGELIELLESVGELDIIFARARLGLVYGGTIPTLSNDVTIKLIELKHPLLMLQKNAAVIGNDISLSEKSGRTLIITGPNTGGKTVLLKSVGLACLMVRTGMMLPSKKGSEIACFNNVFSDIGDEQSLEQSLSTFSSHLTNIIEVVERAGSGSIVLLDEIGAGTDPREGAALAQATLEHLNGSGALTVVTTHASELKTLALTQGGFVNGSFEFDLENFRPTYQFKFGVPGSSQATKIAKKLGLQEKILERTDAILSGTNAELQDTMQLLEERANKAFEHETEARRAAERAQALEQDLQNRLAELEERSEKELRRLSEEVSSEYSTATSMIREITAKLQREPNLAKVRRGQEDLKVIREQLKWADKPSAPSQENLPFQVGDAVQISSINRFGVIKRVVKSSDKGPEFFDVQVGNMKLVVSATDVKRMSERKAPKAESRRDTNTAKGRPARPSAPVASTARPDLFIRSDANTLDLRGTRVDEALSRLSAFIDTSMAGHISPLMIIHGHGRGALKSAVRSELSNSAYAINFRPGETFEGGDGVTVVTPK